MNKKILILGMSPLPFERSKKIYAMNRRTWHFIKPLLDDGHNVCLCGARLEDAYYEDDAKGEVCLIKDEEDFVYYSIEWPVFKRLSAIQEIHDHFNPDCIVGIGTTVAYSACCLKTKVPIWADLYGHLLAEAQTRAYVNEDNGCIHRYLKLEEMVIKKADIFSVVSNPQRFAVIGELALMGRLVKETFGYEFVYVIPTGIEPEEFTHKKKVIRGRYVDEDDFVILWVGGYNSWTDIKTLFEGISAAMEKNPKIKYVSLGGVIKGGDEITFNRFLDMVKSSKFANNFIFLGWIPTEDVPNYYLEADLGINIDAFHYETLLGGRTRINEMLQAGLPVLTSRGTQISFEIEEKNLGLTFPIGDADALKEAILRLSEDQELLRDYGRRGKEYAFNHLTIDKITLPLRRWVNDPKHSPDLKSDS